MCASRFPASEGAAPNRGVWCRAATRTIFNTLARLLASSHEHDVHEGSQPDVKGQIPADMVRIGVDHHLVTVPQPVVAIAIIIGGHAKIETAKPEALMSPSRQPENVAAAKPARKAPVLPGMIEVVVGVIAAGIISNPFAIGMNVRGIGMPFRVAKIAVFLNGVGRPFQGGGTFLGDISPSLLSAAMLFALTPFMLRESGKGKRQQDR